MNFPKNGAKAIDLSIKQLFKKTEYKYGKDMPTK